MINKTTTALIIVLAALLAIWGLTSINTETVKETPPFLSLDTGKVDYVHIKNKDGEVTLRKTGTIWKIASSNDCPANPSYATTLLEKLAELRKESGITSNKDKYKDYELDDAQSAYVEVGKEGGKLEKFYCGKPSKSYTHTYMRKAESNEVWLVAGTPRSSFTRRPKDWRDKTILELDKTMIQSIQLRFPDETVKLEREIIAAAPDAADPTKGKADTTWKVITDKGVSFALDDQMKNRIMNTVSKLRAMDFVDAGTTDTIPDFSRPNLTVDIYLEGNQHETLDLVPKPGDDKRWVIRKNGDEKTCYQVYESTAKNLMKRPDELKGEKKDKPKENA